jgi:AbrB family looped-hinge helix DNA binding protein
MRTTIDRGGRVVIPKSIRDSLGLVPGSEVDIGLDGYTVTVDRVAPAEPRVTRERGLVVLTPPDPRPITDDDVRAIRDATRR